MIQLFFDTETTGLPKNYKASYKDTDNWPRLVQLAWIMYKDGLEFSSSDCVVTPEGFTIPTESSNVHGFTDEIAAEIGLPLKAVLKKFNADIDMADNIVAHNIAFDQNIYGSELVRLGADVAADKFMSKPMICTMESTTDYMKLPGKYGYKWPRLEELYKHLFDEDFDGAHNALNDIRATARCYFELQRRGIMK
jgi:DNA polymerase-3 subunit epsilon